MTKQRGYFGVSLYQPNKLENWGGILRVAYNFDAAFLSTIEAKYRRQSSDTVHASRQIPLFHFKSIEDWHEHLPSECFIVALEVDGERTLESFSHPERAVYLFGGENKTLPKDLWELPKTIRLRIETNVCLNLVSATTCVLYDRHLKQRRS